MACSLLRQAMGQCLTQTINFHEFASAPRALALQPTALLYLHVETNKTTTVAVNANAFPSCNLAQKLRWDVFDVVTVVRLDVYCHHAHAGGIPLFQRALWQHHVTSCRTMADDGANVW